MTQWMRLVQAGVICNALIACGGDINLHSLGDGGGAGAGGAGTAPGGSKGSTPEGDGSQTKPGEGSGGSWGFDAASAGALSIGGRTAPRDRGWGGNGPLPPIEGWLAMDVEYPFSYRGLVLASADGFCQLEISNRLVQEKHPAFSPDGQYLAYASNESGRFQIHVRQLATGHVRRVTDLETGATFPTWSPSASQLAMVEGDQERSSGLSTRRVLVLDMADGQVRPVFSVRATFASQLAAVFVSEEQLLIGTGIQMLSLNLSQGTQSDLVPLTGRIPNPAHPSLSPDRTRFALEDYCGKLGIYIAKLDGSTGDTCEGAFALDSTFAPLRAPAWGPFGMIAAEGQRGIITLLPEDGSPTTDGGVDVYSGTAHNANWAPVDFSVVCDR